MGEAQSTAGGRHERAAAEAKPPSDLLRLLGPDLCCRVIDQLGLVSVTGVDGRIVYANDEFARVSGYSRHELIGRNHRILNSGHHPAEFFAGMYRTITAGMAWRAPIRNKAKDGTCYWVDALIIPLKEQDGRIKGYASVRLDITEAVQLHLDLQERERLLQAVLDNFPGGIAVYDNALNMRLCNETQRKLVTGGDVIFSEGLPSLENLVRSAAERGEYGEGDVDDIVKEKIALARMPKPYCYERARPDGTFVEVRGAPLSDGGFISTEFDITARRRDEAKIELLAEQDPLTGLGNRRRLNERMQSALDRVRRGDMLALHFLDLDHFKPVNDTFGHAAGDALLQAVADRLQSNTRAMDTVVRLGGDEFAILQAGISSPCDAAALAKRIITALSAPFMIGKHAISIGTSVGIAIAPADTTDFDRLLKSADLALYQAKGAGRGSYRFFEQEMDTRVQQRRTLETGLREALRTNRLVVHYQPIVDTRTRRVTSCEALLRYFHPERGLVPASECITVAEETGLIGPIGDWILREACREVRNWPEHVSVAVNVSVAQFRSRDLCTVVVEALDGLRPDRLLLEITESTVMQKDQVTLDRLQSVRDLGVRFALDDFGIGYSSLSYLQSFPFDKLKIDRSFVNSNACKERSTTLLAAIAGLGRALDMTTVAEGVETEEHLDHIRAQGCEEAQGYLFSPAVPAEQLAPMLEGYV